MISILIVNYNMPEAINVIRDSLKTRVKHEWVIVDNGSDVEPHPDTTVQVDTNDGWIPGLVAGLEVINSEFVWVLTTSMGELTSKKDMLTEMTRILKREPDAVTITPGWTGELNAITHKEFAKGSGDYEVIDWASPAAMWRTEYLKENLDARFKSGWGTDYDLKYKTNADGRTCWRCNTVTIEIHEHAGYGSERRKDTLIEHERKASAEMSKNLLEKYGADWRNLLGIL